jgi:hypothetical protein
LRKSIFHEDWWLNALAPGRWREVTCLRGGRVAGYLRFVECRKGGLTICRMPQITRFLGPIVTLQPGNTQARTRATYSIIMELLDQIARYDHVEMTVDINFVELAPFLAAGYEINGQPTILLDCRRKPEELWGGLRDKTRNVIRRARERLTVRDIDDVNLFISFYRQNLEGAESYFDLSFLAPVYAAAYARQQGKIVAAVDSSGVAHAKIFFIWDDKYFHYFLSTRDRNVAHLGAVNLLVWTGIEAAHSRGLWFDFDGGIVNSAKYKFVAAFGGEVANRFEIVRSTSLYQLQHTVRRIPQALVAAGRSMVPLPRFKSHLPSS